MAFNKVILMGNMTDEPQLKQTPSGVSVVSFRIAVGRRFKAEGQPDTDFITIVAWRNTAEFVCRYFHKGDTILVCGQLQQRSYTDKEGIRHNVLEVEADEVSFTGSKRSDTPKTPSAPAAPQAQIDDANLEELGSSDELLF